MQRPHVFAVAPENAGRIVAHVAATEFPLVPRCGRELVIASDERGPVTVPRRALTTSVEPYRPR
jgi:hypothetical protein